MKATPEEIKKCDDLIEVSLSALLHRIYLEHPNVTPENFLIEILANVMQGILARHLDMVKGQSQDQVDANFHEMLNAVFNVVAGELKIEMVNLSTPPEDVEKVTH